VVRPMLTFASSIWHSPRNLRGATEKHVKQLTVMQNTCLRTVLGAYKATPVQVLEAEAAVSPMRIQLDRALLRSKIIRGTHSLVQKGNRRITKKLQPKRGRRINPPPSPSVEKEAWVLRSIGMNAEEIQEGRRNPGDLRKKIHEWWKGRLEGKWEHYQRRAQHRKGTS